MERIIREFPFRNTKTGALTKYLVFLNGKQIYPTGSKRSRTGNHGSDYYALTKDQWRKAWILILQRSNSGKRSIDFIGDIPDLAKKQLADIWLSCDSWIDDIVQLAKILQLSSQLSLKNKNQNQ